MYGRMYFIMLSILILATAAPTNKLQPYGGVHSPIAKLIAIITPKWTGCIPMAVIVGNNIGAITITAGTVSKKHPNINKNIFIKRRITYGLFVTVDKNNVIIWGTFSKVKNVENTVEYPSKNEVIPLITAESTNTCSNCL